VAICCDWRVLVRTALTPGARYFMLSNVPQGASGIFRQFDFSVLEIAMPTSGGPLYRLAALKKISATAAKDTTRTTPENA
jgi:hypothetical protein